MNIVIEFSFAYVFSLIRGSSLIPCMHMWLFFPRKLPSTNDVAQWVKALLEGSFVERVYFASRGFYEVHL